MGLAGTRGLSNEMTDPRIQRVLSLLADIAAGNLDVRLEPSHEDDAIDATIVGLNMLAEELEASRKKLDARLGKTEELATIGQLAAGVAHEINNPLAYIVTNLEVVREQLEVLRRTSATAEIDDAITAIVEAKQGADRVRRIVRGLRAQGHSGDDRFGPVDLQSALRVAVSMLSNEIRHRGRLVEQFSETPKVRADELKLVQLLTNIVHNAAQALVEGQPGSEIRLVTRMSDDGAAIVEIVDNGRGIPDSARARLFEPFYTTKPAGEGTGLGLFVSRSIVRRLGGTIDVDSREGCGTTVRITLPAWSGAEPKSPTPPPDVGKVESGRVLVVDDDPLVGQALRRALSTDHEVVVARSGPAALEQIEQNDQFDVILCDVMMPGMNGPELFGELESRSPKLAERVVFITGGAFGPSAEAFIRRTELDVIEKPFDIRTLRAVVAARTGPKRE